MKCSFTPGGRQFLSVLYFLSHETMQSMCSQSGSKCQTGCGNMSLHIPDSLVAACGSLLFHKESLAFLPVLMTHMEDREVNLQSVSGDVPLNSQLVSLFGFDEHNISKDIFLPAK